MMDFSFNKPPSVQSWVCRGGTKVTHISVAGEEMWIGDNQFQHVPPHTEFPEPTQPGTGPTAASHLSEYTIKTQRVLPWDNVSACVGGLCWIVLEGSPLVLPKRTGRLR